MSKGSSTVPAQPAMQAFISPVHIVRAQHAPVTASWHLPPRAVQLARQSRAYVNRQKGIRIRAGNLMLLRMWCCKRNVHLQPALLIGRPKRR